MGQSLWGLKVVKSVKKKLQSKSDYIMQIYSIYVKVYLRSADEKVHLIRQTNHGQPSSNAAPHQVWNKIQFEFAL